METLSKCHLLPFDSMASSGVKRPLTDSEACSSPQPKKAKSEPTRKFNESWKIANPWLRFDKEAGQMFCDVCIKIQNSNAFTVGTSTFKKDIVTKHAKTKGTWAI